MLGQNALQRLFVGTALVHRRLHLTTHFLNQQLEFVRLFLVEVNIFCRAFTFFESSAQILSTKLRISNSGYMNRTPSRVLLSWRSERQQQPESEQIAKQVT
mmetsp:Transcript_77200/g.208414  ORF Transcript_77200/g.208414 Transcript_77200/m.208414 type:complete len:101 (+) Transcript_77200:179-481(+)